MRFGYFFALYIGVAVSGFSQFYYTDKVAPTTLFAEFLGAGIVYSINLDQVVHENQYFKIAFRAGISKMPQRVTFPVGIALLREIGYGSYVEAGGGYAPVFFTQTTDTENPLQSFNLRLGYRHQQPEGGIFWNFGILYVHRGYFNSDNVLNRIWAGVGVGYTIRKKGM